MRTQKSEEDGSFLMGWFEMGGSSSSGRWGRTGFESRFDCSRSLLLGTFSFLNTPPAPSKALLHARTFDPVLPPPSHNRVPTPCDISPGPCSLQCWLTHRQILQCAQGKLSLLLGSTFKIERVEWSSFRASVRNIFGDPGRACRWTQNHSLIMSQPNF